MQAENSRPTVLCFAGLDPSGGAGLQADIEAIAGCGGHALPISTCLTVQNSLAAFSVHAIDSEILKQQFYALIKDIKISACKIGVIPDETTATCIATLIQQLSSIPIIYDPVLAASYGSQFSHADTIEVIKSSLLPHVNVITPNIKEVNTLLNETIIEAVEASKLCQYGPEYVLVTGADSKSEHVHNTLLANAGLLENYTYPRLPQQYHGSGCTLSSALACLLAQNFTIKQAAKQAQDFTYKSLQTAQPIGQGQWVPKRIHCQ